MGWDLVWVVPKELIVEGISISGKVRAPAACTHASLGSVWMRTPLQPLTHQIIRCPSLSMLIQ